MTKHPVSPMHCIDFLALPRIAVVGASDDPKSFGRTIIKELDAHGRDVVAVHRTSGDVAGRPAYRRLGDIPGSVDGVIVMTGPDAAPGVIDDCAANGVRAVWLFHGVGAPGSVSDEAIARAEMHGIEVIPGACPLMFLDPVHGVHRLHRSIRRIRHDLAPV